MDSLTQNIAPQNSYEPLAGNNIVQLRKKTSA